MQRSIYRQRNWNDASSVFMKSRACSCPWLSSISCSLRTNQKLHTFCSKSNFTLRLKIFWKFIHFLLLAATKGNDKVLWCKTKHFFWERRKFFCPHYFWVLFFASLGERFWDKNYLAHDINFVKELFFPHKLQSFLFGKASFLGNGFEVLNQSLKRFHTKISPKCFCRNFFFLRQRKVTQTKFFWDWFFPWTDFEQRMGEKSFKKECENNAKRGLMISFFNRKLLTSSKVFFCGIVHTLCEVKF